MKNIIKILIIITLLSLSTIFVIIPYINNKTKDLYLNNVNTINSYAINYSHTNDYKNYLDSNDLELIGFNGKKPKNMSLSIKKINQFERETAFSIVYDNYCYYKNYDNDIDYKEMTEGENCTYYGLETNKSCFVTNSNIIESYDQSCGNDIIIPQIINGTKITKIAPNAFSNMNINSVIIQDNIEEIGNESFFNSSIKSLVLGNNIKKIGYKSFYKNNIEELIIPSSIKEIKESAFEENKIKNITFNNNLETIEKRVFANNKIEYLNLNNTKISVLEEESFINNNIAGVTLGDVTKIGKNSFKNNNLMNLTIPKSVIEIEEGAFYKSFDSNSELSVIYVSNTRLKELEWYLILNQVQDFDIVNLDLIGQ